MKEKEKALVIVDPMLCPKEVSMSPRQGVFEDFAYLPFSLIHALWFLAYDVFMFIMAFVVASYFAKVIVKYISTYLLASLIGIGHPYDSLLEVEVGVLFLVFTVSEIQPELESQILRPIFKPVLPETSGLTHLIMTFLYVLLGSACIPFLVMIYQYRFCVPGMDIHYLAGPFDVLTSIFTRCGYKCFTTIDMTLPDNMREQIPLFLALAFMVSGNCLVKLYLDLKDPRFDILNSATSVLTRLICPSRFIPQDLRIEAATVSSFLFGMFHEILMFIILMVLPMYMLTDILLLMTPEGARQSLFWLFMLGFPMAYLGSWIDEASVAIACAPYLLESRAKLENHVVAMVQGGIACDFGICLAGLVGTLCNIYSNSIEGVCPNPDESAAPSRIILNMSSPRVHGLIHCVAYVIYGALKIIIVCDSPLNFPTQAKLPRYYCLIRPIVFRQPKFKSDLGKLMIEDNAERLTQVKVDSKNVVPIGPCGMHV